MPCWIQKSELPEELGGLTGYRPHGRVRSGAGSLLVAGGLNGLVAIGDTCRVERRPRNPRECPPGTTAADDLPAQAVGFRDDGALLLPYGDVARVAFGAGHAGRRPGRGPAAGKLARPGPRPRHPSP